MSDTEDKQVNDGASERQEEVAGTSPSEEKDVAPIDGSEQAEPSGRAESADKVEDGDSDAAAPKAAKPQGAASKKEKNKAPAKADDESDDAYKPGDSVQVKILGYPWWPAVVVTPDHFPAAALAARPTMKTRKDGSSAVSYPVQFLGAPEYYWSRSTDIKALSNEDIKAWIDSGKKSSTKGLKAAYQHALKAPTLEELMEAKTKIEAQQVDEDEDMPDEEEEAADEDADEEIDLDDEGKPIKKSKSKKKAAARTPKKTPSKTPTKKRKTDVDEEEPRPSAKKSRATPRTSAKRNSSPKRDSTSPRQPSTPPSEQPELSPEEAAEQSFKQKKDGVMWLRHRLQKCLLGEKCVEDMLDDIPTWLDRLDPIDVDVRLLRETKIGKVLVRIRRLESIPRDDELGIKSHCSELLEKWREAMETLKKLETEEATQKATPAAQSEKASVNGTAPEKQEQVDQVKDGEKGTADATTNGHESTTNGNGDGTVAAVDAANGDDKKDD